MNYYLSYLASCTRPYRIISPFLIFMVFFIFYSYSNYIYNNLTLLVFHPMYVTTLDEKLIMTSVFE